MHNFTYFIENFWDYTLQGYITSMGYFWYPLVIGGIIGYIYVKTQSVLVFSVGTLLIFVGYASTNIFANVGIFTILLQIIVTLSIAGLIVLFLSRWRR